MSSHSISRKESIPADRLAEASVWIARLHGDVRDRALEASFKRWLKSDPLNAQAFELTTEVWEDSQNLRRVVPFAHDLPSYKRKHSRFSLPRLMIAAAMIVCILVMGTFSFNGNDVATSEGEQRLLTLNDGSRIYLNTETHVTVRYDKSARRIELKSGEALFDVAKHPDRPFVVQVGDRQVTAIGTSFVIRYDGEGTAVTLVDGKVAVTAGKPAPHSMQELDQITSAAMLIPGERLTFAPNQKPRLDRPSIENATAWRRGQVILDNTTLSDAVAEMNRYSVLKLTVTEADAGKLIVNGLFQAGDSLSFANAVALSHGLHVVERGNKIMLEGSPK